jgi:hypothetical protein
MPTAFGIIRVLYYYSYYFFASGERIASFLVVACHKLVAAIRATELFHSYQQLLCLSVTIRVRS